MFLKITTDEMGPTTLLVMSFVVALSDDSVYRAYDGNFKTQSFPIRKGIAEFIKSRSRGDKETSEPRWSIPRLSTFTEISDESKDGFQTYARTTIYEALGKIGHRPLYATVQEVIEAIRRLDISSQREYQRRHKEDSKLSANPHDVYKDWPGFSPIFGSRVYAGSTYKTREEALTACKRLGIKNKVDYKKLRKLDAKLPNIIGFRKLYGSANFASAAGVSRATDKYETMEEVLAACRKLNITDLPSYRKKHTQDSRLYGSPQHHYKGWSYYKLDPKWVDKYSTPKEALRACERLGIKSRSQYENLRKKDPKLPSDPRSYYGKWSYNDLKKETP